MKNLLILIVLISFLLNAETLFEIKDTVGNKVLEVSSDGLRIFNENDTIMVIAAQGIKAFIQPDAKDKALSRTFAVTTTASKDGTKGQNKVFEIATDAGATFYNPSDNTDEILNISKGSITANVNPILNRDFVVNDQASAGKVGGGNLMKVSNEDVFETVNDSTMLWYKQKNAFRVGHVIIDHPDSVGQASFSAGSRNIASNYSSIALGSACKSSGHSSVALGSLCEARQNYSFASGVGSIASATAATSMGFECLSSGGSSFATGDQTGASGYCSATFGMRTNASGQGSASFGSANIAQPYCSFYTGRYAVTEGNSDSWIETDPLFVVGNGTGLSTRKNALTVLKNGNVGIGMAPSASYKLSVANVDNSGIMGSGTTSSQAYINGVYGVAGGATTRSVGIFGYTNSGVLSTRWAGYFEGNINVTGTVVKSSSKTVIDHPLDPKNKFLVHSSVESDKMMNIYNGIAVLDGNGRAIVKMADWFEALNTNFRYQLTPIGAPGPNLYIAKKISGNSFEIAGGEPGMEVSWEVTGMRNDNYAKEVKFEAEKDKDAIEKGYYLHPESYGLSEDMGIEHQHQKRMNENSGSK